MRASIAAAVLVALFCAGSPALAQDAAARSDAPASPSPDGAWEDLRRVHVPRPDQEIAARVEWARGLKKSAESERGESRRLVGQVDARIAGLREDIRSAERRRDHAGAGADPGAAGTEDGLRRLQDELKYLTLVRDGILADLARMDADVEAAAADIEALEQEQRLERRFREWSRSASSDREVGLYHDLLRTMLQSQQASSSKAAAAAQARGKVAGLKLQQLALLGRRSN